MKILVVVDVQKDFVDGALGTDAALAIIPAVKAKIAEYRANDGAIFFTRDTHGSDYLETQEGKNLPVPHCIRGTEGHDLFGEIAKLVNLEEDVILDKCTFGSEELVDEITYIQDCDEDVETIELVGLCTGICVLANAVLLKTALPEAKIIVDADACACVNPISHETALRAMNLLQITIKGARLND